MHEFIPSEYYRNYCKENGIEITDRSLAAAILNGYLESMDNETPLFEEKFRALKKIAAETEDNELKALISEATENKETALENLKKGGENCIYKMDVTLRLIPEDMYSYEFLYFYDYKTAFNYALYHTKEIGALHSFSIERIRVFTGEEPPKTRGYEEHAYFNSLGNVLRIYGGKEHAFDVLCDYHIDANSLNDLDIVMQCYSGELGIVTDVRDDPQGRGEIFVLFDFAEDGNLSLTNPMCLEKVESTSDPKLRERAVKVIRKQLIHFNDEERALLEKTIAELSGA